MNVIPEKKLTRPSLLAMMVSIAIGGAGFYSLPAVSATLSGNQVIDGRVDHSQDIYQGTGTLRIDNGGKLGLKPGIDTSVMLMGQGQAIVNGTVGAIFNMQDHSHLSVGTDPIHRASMQYLLLQNSSNAVIDNATISAGAGNGTSALELHDNSIATINKNAIISGKGSNSVGDRVSGVSLNGTSHLEVNGAIIEGSRVGIVTNRLSHLDTTNAHIQSEYIGLYVADSSQANINGGQIVSTGEGNNHLLVDDVTNAALQVSTNNNSTPDGHPVATVKDAQISAQGSNSAAVLARGNSEVNLTNSNVSGGKYGIYVATANGDNSLGNILSLTNSHLSSRTAEAMHVSVNGKAAIHLLNTQVTGGNHVFLVTDSGSDTNLSVDGSNIQGKAINNGGNTQISLTNGAWWTGAAQNVNAVSLASGTHWNVTGLSTVTGDLSNTGTVTLSDDGSATRNTLTVGNYTGNGGTLVFNSVLADDNSPTDKLVIQGDSSGTSQVVVNNLGGKGAQTQNGIPLIRVSGAAKGDFQQKGRIVAGAYDYNLQHSADNKDWYLASRLQQETFTHNNDSPTLLYRPEAGSYIANQAAANTMFITRLRDRLGETRYIDSITGQAGVTTLWLRQVGSHNGFHSGPDNQLKTQSNTYVAQLGGELANGSTDGHDSWHLGVMGGYGQNHSDTLATTTSYKAKGTVTGYSVGAYATWLANDADKTGPYVDTWLQYGWFNNKVDGDQLSGESYKSSGFTASVETGYTFNLGHSGGGENPTYYYVEPNIQAIWMDVRRNDLRESNGTATSGADEGNLQTRVGTRFLMKGHSKIDNGKDRNFQPFVEVNWIHNTKQFAVNMDGFNISQNGATDIGELKVGVEGQLSKAVQLWGNVGQQIGGKGYSNTTAMLGVKYSFR